MFDEWTHEGMNSFPMKAISSFTRYDRTMIILTIAMKKNQRISLTTVIANLLQLEKGDS
jgi:hypothetical protein